MNAMVSDMSMSTCLAIIVATVQLSAQARAAGSDVVERPIHQVVRVGQDVRFHCRSGNPNDTLRWDYRPTPALNNQLTQLYNGNRINSNFTDRYSVSNLSDTHRDLDIRSAQQSDAGTYICFTVGDNGSFAASLVVLGLEPECSVSVKLSSSGYPTDDAEVTCRVSYTGDWSPSFQCTPQSPSQHISVEHVPPQSVTYRQRISLNTTDVGNVTVTCWMHFNVTDLRTDEWKWNTTFDNLVPEYAWSAYHLKSTWQNCANSSTPGAESDGPGKIPQWIMYYYLYVAITTTVVVGQTVALVVCYRKMNLASRRLNGNDSTSPASTSTSPETHIRVGCILNADPSVSSSDSRSGNLLLYSTSGYAELAASPRRFIRSKSAVSGSSSSSNIITNNTDSISVAADSVYASILHKPARPKKFKIFGRNK